MPRTKSSQRWLARHVKDDFVKRARKEGARSRAAYKLMEIDRRDRLLRPGMTVVDLGAAPGGWSQYVSSRVGSSGRVVALDILPMEPIPGVEAIEGNIVEQPVLDLLMERLRCAGTNKRRGRQAAESGHGQNVNLVISDMAPNMSGVATVDQARSIQLAELALDFADKMLQPGGSLLIKTFQGEGFNELYARMRHRFEKLVSRKPQASRSESREIYLLGKGIKGPDMRHSA